MQKRISHNRLLEIMRYSKRTGLFTSLVNRPGHLRVGDIVGSINVRGYVRTMIDGQHYYMHRLAWFYVTGTWPKDEIDHKNGCYWDNRWRNLREANSVTNGRNRKIGCNNTSGVIGVYWFEKHQKWAANIKLQDRRVALGTFDSYEEAVAARVAAEKKHFAEFSRMYG